jgi:pseudoazurin
MTSRSPAESHKAKDDHTEPYKDPIMSLKHLTFTIATLTAITIGTQALSAEIEVHMLNKGAKGTMVFEPDFIQAAPGDTIKFVPVNPGHNVEGIKGMLPNGVEDFKSKPSQPFTLTVTKEGIYGVKCMPHYGMGMVALIEVGKPINLDAAKAVKQVGKAKAKFTELFAQVK